MKRRKHRVYQPGLAPGTIRERPASEAVPLEITIADYTPASIEVREAVGIDEIAAAPAGGNRWIRIRGTPTTALLRQIGAQFGAHNLVLEDISSSSQRVKVEDYDNLMFTVLRAIRESDEGEQEEVELSIILTTTTIITIFETTDASFFEPILARLGTADSLIRHHRVDFIYHAILDLAVDCFFPVVQRLEESAEVLEDDILESAEEEHLRAIHLLRSSSQQVRRIMWATRDVISRIERSTHRFIDRETLFYFRDIHDHIVHLLDAISTLRDTASGLMELHMSGVSNRMNEVMKVLTIISTLFIPGTFLAGIYGMNFEHMPELAVRWAYPAVWGVIGLVVIGMLIFFKRRRWF